MWRLPDRQHGSDQVVQRPRQVVLGDHGNLVIDAKVIDRLSRDRNCCRPWTDRHCEPELDVMRVANDPLVRPVDSDRVGDPRALPVRGNPTRSPAVAIGNQALGQDVASREAVRSRSCR